jgi:hypothetical protein
VGKGGLAHPLHANDALEGKDAVVLVLVELGVIAQVVGRDEQLASSSGFVATAISCAINNPIIITIINVELARWVSTYERLVARLVGAQSAH